MEQVEIGAARSKAVWRLSFLVAALVLWAAVIFGKLVSVQIFHHAKYLASARRQQELKIELPAIRGNIYDRNGHALAMSVSIDSVSINPLNVPNAGVAAEILSQSLHLDQQKLYDRIMWCRANKRGFLSIKKKLTPVESERLRSLAFNWIDFHTDSHRLYPNGEIAAHVLGGVYQQQKGVAGIEKRMDAVLRGKGGMIRLLADVKHRGIESRVEDPARPGESLQLTIDERIQFVAERELKAAVEKHRCTNGSVVVMNPYNGEILALANYPTYDPNVLPVLGDKPQPRFNLGVQIPFEPGSIFKVITLAAALETTDLKPTSMIATGNGALSLPGRVVHDTHPHGTISMQEVLEQSSNIGAIKIGAQVGRARMNDYVHKFGFGRASGVPLPAESWGVLRDLDKWGTTSLASISMGQEIGATSMQLARACAVIANGGLLVKPKLILKRGAALEPTEAPVRILKSSTAITMRQMMEGVVLRGTGRRYCKLDGYTSGGKTGSAQIFDNKAHRYTHTYNASFMGFAPVTNPALIVMVTLTGTVGEAGFGGPSAGPVFNQVATEALRILDVPKDLQETAVPAVQLAKNDVNTDGHQDMAGLNNAVSDGHNILEDASQLALAELAIPADAASAPDNGDAIASGPQVPDFRGKTVREVVRSSSESGVLVLIAGTGIAQAQSPAPGTPLAPGTKVRVQFRR